VTMGIIFYKVLVGLPWPLIIYIYFTVSQQCQTPHSIVVLGSRQGSKSGPGHLIKLRHPRNTLSTVLKTKVFLEQQWYELKHKPCASTATGQTDKFK
jgi:hypothetical protein